jgi:cellulose synthase/poly-beta-1,6-N-acetylglucosamine synthase-like glycosyltransferase/peptidoglycan/xylan/chitin deacetylase (PgdA/CDA1 family)
MNYGYGLDYEGSGDILKVTGRPNEGLRDIKFDPARRMITSSKFLEFPSPYVITRYGGVKNKIALTFDDGPDPAYTPAILDALRAANAPATFFVVGLNGEQYPSLLKRELAEGHEIGNHTFTHPNVANISDRQFGLELSATQFLFESVLGRSTHLFRPPFAEDSEPDTPDEVHPIDLVSGSHYFTIGMQIDPEDWKRPGVDAIVASTVSLAQQYAVPGKDGVVKGNIVLLHDSGGDRSQTVKALPLLIAALREHGFELVTVSELMGKSRDEVMPLVPRNMWWQTWAGRTAFATINFSITAIHVLFLAGIVLGIGRLLFIGTLAVIEHWRERHAAYFSSYSPTVAVIVPAFNEEKVIVQTITSLLGSDHPPNFEIVVVDDGSTDDTYRRVREAFADEPRVRLFTKPNSGKSDALNYGVGRTSAEIVIALDADTIFARDTISKLVRHFADPKVGAVAGNAKVGNRINLLTRWQALEYITSQNLDRRAFNLLNCITVVPGAVGAWRRELVERAGGFTHLTLAEDADLTMAIRKLGYSIAYEDEAIGLTEAPDTLRGFIRQRYRWMYGTLQAAWKHIDALCRPRYGSLGFVALPNIFIFQVFFPLISPAMDLLMLVTLITSAINKWQHPSEFSADSLWRALFYYAIFVALEFAAAGVAFLLEPKENRRLLVWLFWQRFFYRQLMYYVAIKSTLASLRGVAVGWQKLERKATVKAHTDDVGLKNEN